MIEARTEVTDLLTLIVTTSPTPTAPSTELLSTVLASFYQHCPALLTCRVIVSLDAYDRIGEQPRLKKGQVTARNAEAYEQYKINVKRLVLDHFSPPFEQDFVRSSGEAEFGSPEQPENSVIYSISQTANGKVMFIEPEQRLGFSLAVRSALRMTATPCVWVHQHDWTLTADIPVEALLEVMRASEPDAEVPIKYICFPAVRMLRYAVQSDEQRHPALKDLTQSLKGTFTPASQSETQIPLTPLFFWHDKPHIAFTEHYLARIFPSRLAMRRGDFIEDTIGQRARGQMKDGEWHKWACWLYYPDEGRQLCLKHLDGRVWRGVEGEERQKLFWLGQRRNFDPEKPSYGLSS